MIECVLNYLSQATNQKTRHKLHVIQKAKMQMKMSCDILEHYYYNTKCYEI